MSNLFKKPIICELTGSISLATSFVILAIVPAISLLTLVEKHPFIISSLIIVVIIYSIYCIRQYALRKNSTSVTKLRLHNNHVKLKQNNGLTKFYNIKRVSMSPEWVIVILEKPGPKIIIDEWSAGQSIYSEIRREINNYKLQ